MTDTPHTLPGWVYLVTVYDAAGAFRQHLVQARTPEAALATLSYPEGSTAWVVPRDAVHVFSSQGTLATVNCPACKHGWGEHRDGVGCLHGRCRCKRPPTPRTNLWGRLPRSDDQLLKLAALMGPPETGDEAEW